MAKSIEKHNCPLLNKIIYDSDCYDINMIAGGMIKETAIKEKIYKEKALKVCKNCECNTMK